MTAFSVVATVALWLLALAGYTAEVIWVALGLFVLAVAFHAEFLRLACCGRRLGRQIPRHRQRLDRIVRAQWIGVSAGGLVMGILCSTLAFAPLDSGGRFADALIVGVVIASLAIFVSSLIDWYLILPKVSGLARPAPCENPGGERWKYVTAIWYFHRSVATMITYGVATGIPAYMGSEATGSAQIAWAVVAGAVVAVAGIFSSEMFRSSWYSLKPPIHVGDLVHLRIDEEGDGDVLVWRRRGYVADVSIQGSECKALIDGRYKGGRFTSKGDRTITNESLPERKVPSNHVRPLCADGHCSGVNWYCRHNPQAHA